MRAVILSPTCRFAFGVAHPQLIAAYAARVEDVKEHVIDLILSFIHFAGLAPLTARECICEHGYARIDHVGEEYHGCDRVYFRDLPTTPLISRLTLFCKPARHEFGLTYQVLFPNEGRYLDLNRIDDIERAFNKMLSFGLLPCSPYEHLC